MSFAVNFFIWALACMGWALMLATWGLGIGVLSDKSCEGIRFISPPSACDKPRIKSLRTIENPVFEDGDEDDCDDDGEVVSRVEDRCSHDYDAGKLKMEPKLLHDQDMLSAETKELMVHGSLPVIRSFMRSFQ
ncbi:hypothetical protein CEUSTIGMA_g6259.t1 [Chlamydomonas eustigma]|uniref:Uncharacterized protein n=1 Tax=Chlamydomonas eustigma TaxID=1157962 RepID=A0A250X7F7_9CHLO|nr:hypothetical protein CEUSTIGMA_g6259.t1 [Chlamydomonas eustigma]|eukprot:GAX78822.1 hypothetical protein CEUSTIGMA_g6259.t1 [Chlamydomonas eustigma]